MEDPKHPSPTDLDAERARAASRFEAVHFDHLDLDQLSPQLGNAEEWLGAAMSHVSVQHSTAVETGAKSIDVSVAALTLLMAKIEELLFGGQPWPWPDEDAPLDADLLRANGLLNLINVALASNKNDAPGAQLALVEAMVILTASRMDAADAIGAVDVLADHARRQVRQRFGAGEAADGLP